MKPRVEFESRRTGVMATGLILALAAVAAAVLSESAGRAVDTETLAAGKQLFEHQWQPNDRLATHGDGLGPVFNARSCAECHFQAGVGGAGPNEHNVLTFDVAPTAGDPEVHAGVIHKFALAEDFVETRQQIRDRFPVVKGIVRVVRGCTYTTPNFDPVSFAEINTPALFGAGLVDRISDGAISRKVFGRRLQKIGEEFNLDFEGTPAGRARVLPDGRIGKFGWKGQFATLEEFVGTACAVELGLSNPLRRQDLPRTHAPDSEAKLDMDRVQLRSLVAYVDQLPAPVRMTPTDATFRKNAHRGEQVFAEIGCADCHTPSLGGVEGLYSDLLLHDVLQNGPDGSYAPQNEPVRRPSDEPRPDEWKTPPLWGVADSAPYFHDGATPTLRGAILRHKGEARYVTERYEALRHEDQQAVIAFLNTLRAPAATAPDGQLVSN